MINTILNEADQKMDKSVEATREEFATIRAGRANPAMFAKLTADYYGTQTPLQQLASFTSQDARTIIVAPFDMGAVANIEKAIRTPISASTRRTTARPSAACSPS